MSMQTINKPGFCQITSFSFSLKVHRKVQRPNKDYLVGFFSQIIQDGLTLYILCEWVAYLIIYLDLCSCFYISLSRMTFDVTGFMHPVFSFLTSGVLSAGWN